jgi:hypothetical protein
VIQLEFIMMNVLFVVILFEIFADFQINVMEFKFWTRRRFTTDIPKSPK